MYGSGNEIEGWKLINTGQKKSQTETQRKKKESMCFINCRACVSCVNRRTDTQLLRVGP